MTFVIGLVVLFAAFVVSLVGVFKKNAAKWPSIVGMILSILGGVIGTVVTLVIVAVSLAGPIDPATPTGVPSPTATEQSSESPVSPQPSDSQAGEAGEGRPSPEEIATLYGQMFRDGGNTNYDDMPEFWPCMGQQLYDSDISDESLWLIIRGQEPLPAESTSAGEEIVEAGLFCDPDGEGAWG
nr:hypothetical protein [uncultured Microbacterium sp.]